MTDINVQNITFDFVASGDLTWSNSVHDGTCHRERTILWDNFRVWKTGNPHEQDAIVQNR